MFIEKILVAIFGFVIMLVLRGLIYNMLVEAGVTRKNYREEDIPIGLGIAYTIAYLVGVLVAGFYFESSHEGTLVIVLGVLGMSFVGLMDDLIGDTKTKGFKGHVKALLRGKLTTGGLKALSGFGLGAIISLIISEGAVEVVTNTFLIALFTNAINLFDLRPGRACKVFLGALILLILTSSYREWDFAILVGVGVVLAYIRYDLDAKSMLGDVGSNAMGMTLGVISSMVSPIYVKFILLSILILLHVLAEFYSFTDIIEKSAFLRKIDQLGRR